MNLVEKAYIAAEAITFKTGDGFLGDGPVAHESWRQEAAGTVKEAAK